MSIILGIFNWECHTKFDYTGPDLSNFISPTMRSDEASIRDHPTIKTPLLSSL
jgi:hypothetical protein